MKRLSAEQIKTLSAWEDNFRTAINAQWARNPGTAGLKVIHGIYTQVTGDQRRFNDNCNHCILSLLKDCGAIYFRDKAEMEEKAKAEEAARIAAQLAKEAEEASSQAEVTDKAVGVSPAPAEPVEKVEVKTDAPKTTKPRKPRTPKTKN